MVSNQQNLNQVGIDEFLCALLNLDVNNNEISGEQLKIKYSNAAPYSTHQRHSTPTKYQDEEEDIDEKIRPPRHRHRVHKDKKTSSSSLLHRGNGYVYNPHGRKTNILYVYYFIT